MEYNEERNVQICQHCYSENDADKVGEGIIIDEFSFGTREEYRKMGKNMWARMKSLIGKES